ncbi:MAG: cysteine--tRNA ligase [Paracoccaceae bacterium]|jgi:cysteinyl-tRNA synthetase|nr:cysteine--tRNA ligase [Paracoccaceae bacterium]
MTEIKLYNSKTRSKSIFSPLDPKNVRMYVCGPTVYDRAHIGNARPVIIFDILFRLLRYKYGEKYVNYARNFTDVDDKINASALRTGRTIREITNETIKWFISDMQALGNLEPSYSPRATEYIEQMISMNMELLNKGYAYEAENHLIFEVQKYKNYGSLSGRSIDDMIAGARVEVAPYKKNPMDFILWKPSEANEPGWDSPWGYGRPGWHIECSAMSREIFGSKFDIHGGGLDLAFPHHENEIAQSCSLGSEDEFAQIWMHNEMLQVNGKKMSKSLGNFFSPKDLIDQGISGDSLRLMYLGTHYRKPLDWTENKVEESQKLQKKWEKLVANCESGVISEKVLNAVADDLNTPLALSEMHKLAKSGNVKDLKASGSFLGLFDNPILNKSETILSDELQNLITELLKERADARLRKDYAKADKLRDGFVKAGLIINDTENGIDWELKEDFDLKKLEALKW